MTRASQVRVRVQVPIYLREGSLRAELAVQQSCRVLGRVRPGKPRLMPDACCRFVLGVGCVTMMGLGLALGIGIGIGPGLSLVPSREGGGELLIPGSVSLL